MPRTKVDAPISDMESVTRMSRDLAAAARTMSDDEARFLVDQYYTMQEQRKRAANQVRALGGTQEPNSVLRWLQAQGETLESQVQRALDKYTQAHPMGEWMRGIFGIGPVISAGLLAHINMDMCPTAGHIWSYAGWAADGQKPWEKGKMRPYNVEFRTLCFKAGDSFVKFSTDERCYYGQIYKARRSYEIDRNDTGGHIEQAKRKLEMFNFGKDTESYRWYSGCYPAGTTIARENVDGDGADRIAKRQAYVKSVELPEGEGMPMLPPAHILARARRYAAKMFLSHLHGAWYQQRYGRPAPAPFAVQVLGHVHIIPPPFPPPPSAEPREFPAERREAFEGPFNMPPRDPPEWHSMPPGGRTTRQRMSGGEHA